jgi:hypothetical protein
MSLYDESRQAAEALPLAVRLKIIRRRRRTGAFHRMTVEALWLVFLAAAGVLVVTGLLGAIGRV